MSNWITITKSDLYNSKAAALIDAVDQVSLGANQTDRTTGVLADVTLEIRRRVAKCNQLDQNTTAIPAGFKPLAVDLAYVRLKNALELPLTDDERLSLAQRENQLDRIADGRDVVEPPDNPIARQPGSGAAAAQLRPWPPPGIHPPDPGRMKPKIRNPKCESESTKQKAESGNAKTHKAPNEPLGRQPEKQQLCYTQDLWPLLQRDLLGVIQADDFLGTRLGVLVEPGDLDSVIHQKLAKIVGPGLDGKHGVGFLVLPIERADDDNASLPGGPLKLTLRIQWAENVILNQSASGTRKPMRIFTAQTEKILKLYTPVGLTQSLVPAKPVISEFTDDSNQYLRLGQVEFTAVEADFTPFRRVSRPLISVAGVQASACSPNSYQLTATALVSVTAAAGATIYYTTDGTHPYQGNASAQVYSGPVSIVEPCLFRARAFIPGQTGSDTAAASFWQ